MSCVLCGAWLTGGESELEVVLRLWHDLWQPPHKRRVYSLLTVAGQARILNYV